MSEPMSEPVDQPQQWDEPTPFDPPPPVYAAPLSIRERLGRVLAPIGAALAALVKFGAIIFQLKVFTVAASMIVSIAAYATIWGWTFAAGFVLLILVHELGHVVALRRMGIKAGAPVFLPFLGAFVSMKEQPRTAWEEAVSGIAGPVFGTGAAVACWWYAHETGSEFALSLAFVGFFLNLFNLIPILPLDGGRTAAALHPAIWVLGLVGLLVLEIYRPTPLIPIILIFGGLETWRRWKHRDSEASRTYYALSGDQRRIVGLAYLGLVVFLVFAMHGTYVERTF